MRIPLWGLAVMLPLTDFLIYVACGFGFGLFIAFPYLPFVGNTEL